MLVSRKRMCYNAFELFGAHLDQDTPVDLLMLRNRKL